MNHPISAEDWIDYFDGTLAPGARSRVDRHLRQCPECRAKADRLQHLEQYMGGMASVHRAVAVVDDADTRAASDAFAAQLRSGALITARLARAHSLLAAICGPAVSHQVVRKAAQRASVSSPDQMQLHDWPNFLGHLTGIMSSLCGHPAAATLSRALAL